MYKQQKSVGVAYLLNLFFFGLFGSHQFYMGNTGRGLLYLFTFGCLGIMPLVDLFTMASQVERVNALIRQENMDTHKALHA